MRSPLLHDTLHRFCLGAFAVFLGELDNGGRLPFAFEEHGSHGRPSLYEYRPLVRGFVEARADRLFERLRRRRRDRRSRARAGGADLRARARQARRPTRRARSTAASSCRSSSTSRRAAAASTGTTTSSTGRTRSSRQSLFGDGHAYGAVAPLIGLSVGTPIELGDGIRVRQAATGELVGDVAGSERACCRATSAARPTGCACSSSSGRSRRVADEAPDAPGELADAVTAIRLATAAPVAAGPVLFERLDWRPYGIRPVLPIAATAPPGEPTRLDPFRASVAAEAPRAPRDRRRRPAARRRARPLGARALPGRPVPRRAASARARRRARRGRRHVGRVDARRRAARRDGGRSARASSSGSATPTCDLVRRLLVAVLLHGNRARAAARARRRAARLARRSRTRRRAARELTHPDR